MVRFVAEMVWYVLEQRSSFRIEGRSSKTQRMAENPEIFSVDIYMVSDFVRTFSGRTVSSPLYSVSIVPGMCCIYPPYDILTERIRRAPRPTHTMHMMIRSQTKLSRQSKWLSSDPLSSSV